MRSKKQIIQTVLVAVFLLAVPVFASGRINGIRIVSGNAELTIETVLDKRYQILCCTDLVDGEWTSVRRFIATAGTTIQSIESSETSCFFRVEEIEEAPIITPPPPTTPPPPPPPS